MAQDNQDKIVDTYLQSVRKRMKEVEAQDGKIDSTYLEAEAAKDKLAVSLSAKFNEASPAADLVNGLGVARDDRGSYVIVSLTYAPSKEEKQELPQKQDGVRVVYRVTGGAVAGL